MRRSDASTDHIAHTHTVQVHHLHLAQFGWRGPQLHLKCRGLAHTLSATSLSEVALRRTCTESIRKKSTLKTALTKKKTKFALSTLGVIYFLIYLPNYRKIAPSPLCGARASQPCSPPYAQHGILQPATGHTGRHSLQPYATLCHPCSHPTPFLFVDRRRMVLRSSRATSPTRLTQQHQLRSRRAFFAFVCAGIASTGATVHQRGLFARENATLRAAVSSL